MTKLSKKSIPLQEQELLAKRSALRSQRSKIAGKIAKLNTQLSHIKK